MTVQEQTLFAVAEVVADVFQVPVSSVTGATDAHDVEGWDSLAHARVILALERRFGIRLPARQAFTAANVGALSDLVVAAGRK